MNKSFKPEQLLLPPDFIHYKDFHRFLIAATAERHSYSHNDRTSPLTSSDYSYEYKLWYFVLSQRIICRSSTEYLESDNNKRLELLKSFCECVKGLCIQIQDHSMHGQTKSIQHPLNQSILYLEGLLGLPDNLYEESFMDKLREKYRILETFSEKFEGKWYFLLDTYTRYIGRTSLPPYKDLYITPPKKHLR